MMDYKKEFQKATAYHQAGNLLRAKNIYEKILKEYPKSSDVLNMLGVIFFQKKIYNRSLDLIKKSININSKISTYHVNLGNVYKDLEKYDESINCYEKAINLQPDHFGAYNNLGLIYNRLRQHSKSSELFNKAININPKYSDAYINLGHTLIFLKKYDQAKAQYNKAIEIDPKNSKAYLARGELYLILKQYNNALSDFNCSIILNDELIDAYYSRSKLYDECKNYEKSIEDLEKIISIKEDYPYILGSLVHAYLKISKWLNYKKILSKVIFYAKKNTPVCPPLAFLSFVDDPYLQKNLMKITNATYLKKNNNFNFSNSKKKKITIGYYSPDFREHPISYLMHDVINQHNQNNFEIFGFYFGPKIKSNDTMHIKLKKSFNKFFDVSTLSDLDIVKLSRELNIDIAVDLAGHTENARTEIFFHGCAPIQINYLGYPGTMGVNGIDYIIADKNVIPENFINAYNEKIIYIDCYQANEFISKKNIDTTFTKKILNLPENNFIYCCFNNSWKITPDIFDLWVKILKSVPNSVLWLLKSNSIMETNIKKEAQKKNLDPNRIIFADVLSREKHLHRQVFADLFLDTYPYGAHTTCSDSLRSNVPVLTLSGSSFASRVSSSIIKKLNLDELITSNFDEYVKKAIEIGSDFDKLKKIKMKTLNEVKLSDLFDAKHRANVLENAYIKIYKEYHKD